MTHINHQIKHRSHPNDVFITPKELAWKQIQLHDVQDGDTVLDPCCYNPETGSYISQFSKLRNQIREEWCEFSYGKDFLTYQGTPDHIIANPPYSMLDTWFKKTIDLKPKQFSMLIGINNLTARRMEWCEKAGYGLSHMEMLKVKEWFGMSVIVVFKQQAESVMKIDRKVYYGGNKDEEKPKKKYKFVIRKPTN